MISVPSQLRKSHEILTENQTQSKRTGNVVQVMEHLPIKHEPRFNPQYGKKLRKLPKVIQGVRAGIRIWTIVQWHESPGSACYT
jgi:hypothetical protein